MYKYYLWRLGTGQAEEASHLGRLFLFADAYIHRCLKSLAERSPHHRRVRHRCQLKAAEFSSRVHPHYPRLIQIFYQAVRRTGHPALPLPWKMFESLPLWRPHHPVSIRSKSLAEASYSSSVVPLLAGIRPDFASNCPWQWRLVAEET